MPGTSDANACAESAPTQPVSPTNIRSSVHAGAHIPQSAEVDTWEASVHAATHAINQLHQYNRDTGQRGRSFTLPITPGCEATIPVWSGRTEWLRQLRHHITHTTAGRAALTAHSIGIERLMAVATAHARFADSTTGRGVTASRQLIAHHAGVSLSVVNRARRVLKTLAMGVEVERGRTLRTREYLAAELHHGGQQHQAASVWALSSPKHIVDATPPPPQRPSRPRRARAGRRLARHRTRPQQPNAATHPQATTADTLSPSTHVPTQNLSLRSTHQRAHARPTTSIPQPRPLHLQRAAAILISRSPVLARGHIGNICDTIQAAGIDTTRWTGHDIAQTLDRDTRERGWTWPTADQISSPAALFRWRLTHIDWTGPSPSQHRTTADATRRREQAARQTAIAHRNAAQATLEQRHAALAQICQTLRQARHAATSTRSPRNKSDSSPGSPTPSRRASTLDGVMASPYPPDGPVR
ncbi:Rep protein [Rhodococcus wratislaviensis]|uniref:Replication protein n=1 Tax=Rhodococcus wratislaviensis NBRC 100605 TaxID=1219028 RepID=X0RC04_RHOWR|nr:Rep protein [Rhodococcus wratislaviensis]GAF48540.1 replication protein [Rhodococcus wratislaviensis NBRC 100605]